MRSYLPRVGNSASILSGVVFGRNLLLALPDTDVVPAYSSPKKDTSISPGGFLTHSTKPPISPTNFQLRGPLDLAILRPYQPKGSVNPRVFIGGSLTNYRPTETHPNLGGF